MIDDFQNADSAIADFIANHTAGLSDSAKTMLNSIAAHPVPPARVAHFAEFAYANASALDDAAKLAAAEIAEFATGHQFYGLGYLQRGEKMIATLKGETVTDAPVADSAWTVA